MRLQAPPLPGLAAPFRPTRSPVLRPPCGPQLGCTTRCQARASARRRQGGPGQSGKPDDVEADVRRRLLRRPLVLTEHCQERMAKRCGAALG